MLKEKVDKLVDKYLDEVISIRRHIHQNPELSLKEFETSKFVANELRKIGLEAQEGVGKTGVVSNLNLGKGEKTLMLRADMDALPIHATLLGSPLSSIIASEVLFFVATRC